MNLTKLRKRGAGGRRFGNYDLPGRTCYAVNPIAMRCSNGLCPVGERGHCWHRKAAARLAANPTIDEARRAAYAGGPAVVSWAALDAIEKLPAGSTVALQFMGDLMDSGLPLDLAPTLIDYVAARFQDKTILMLTREPYYYTTKLTRLRHVPKHIYLGASAGRGEAFARACVCLGEMRRRGWHTWVSLEPLLEKIHESTLVAYLPSVDWVALGPETGPGARPCAVEWLLDVGVAADCLGVPLYDKRDNAKAGDSFLGRRAPWAPETLDAMAKGLP